MWYGYTVEPPHQVTTIAWEEGEEFVTVATTVTIEQARQIAYLLNTYGHLYDGTLDPEDVPTVGTEVDPCCEQYRNEYLPDHHYNCPKRCAHEGRPFNINPSYE